LVSLIIVFVGIVSADSGDVYAIVTEGLDVDELEVYTVKVNTQTGSLERVVGNFLYLTGFSETYDGISGYDQDQDIIYYSTDTDSAFVYSADVHNQQLIAPISLGATAVLKMVYDSLNKRMIFTIVANRQLNMVAWSTIGSGYNLLNSRISQFDVEYYVDGTLDSKNQLYYMMFGNSTGMGWATFSTSSPNSPISSGTLNCGVPGLVLNYIVYDPILSTIHGVGENASPTLKYFLIQITPGSYRCTAQPIKTQEFGIATAFSFLPSTHTLYVAWAPDGPGKLYSVNVRTGATSGLVIQGGVVITDVEVEF